MILFSVATVYFLAGRFGLSMASVHPSASAVWPPTGLAIAAATLLGYRIWPAILVGSLFVNVMQTGDVPSSLGIACGNTAEAVVGAWFLIRAGGREAFNHSRTQFRFIVFTGLLSTALSASVGVASLFLRDLAGIDELWPIWLNWWVGDSNSALILAPLLVMASDTKFWRVPSRRRFVEDAALTLALILLHVVVFGGFIPGAGRLYLLGYLGITLFLCIAFRYGQLGSAIAVAGVSVIAIWGTLADRGPFAPEDMDLSMVLLQLYLGSLSVTMLNLSAVVWSRKRTQAELDDRKKSLDNIIRTVPGVVWEAWKRQDRAALHLDYVSPYVESMLGYSTGKWLSTPGFWLSVIHPEDKERVAREAAAFFEEGKGGVINFRWIARDGRVVDVENRTVVLLDSQGKPEGMLGITMDISDRLKVEKRLLLSEEQLRYGQKMEAVGRLAGGVAHDFNNLLTSILGYTDLLMAQLEPPSPMIAYAKEILAAGERAAAMIRQLLAFSRQEVIQPRPLDLNNVVAEMEGMLRRIIGASNLLKISLQPGLHPIKADRDQIWQMILNLVENSRDALPEGGVIVIETANVRASEEADDFFLKPRAEECVRFTVRDNGVGIGKEAMVHLFDPFFTTKKVSKGVGLGLSTVYAIVDRNGGGLRVISELGSGSVFQIYLPRTMQEEVQEVPSPQAAGTDTPAEGSGNILLLEEDEGARVIIAEILKKKGFSVLEACDTKSALALLEKGAGTLSLLLVDIIPPADAALKMTEALFARHAELKVVFLVEYLGQIQVPPALPADRVVLMEKVFTPQQLIDVVDEMLAEPVSG